MCMCPEGLDPASGCSSVLQIGKQKCRCLFTSFEVDFHVYVQLKCKNAVLGAHLSCLGCLSRSVSSLVISEREKGVVALHQPFETLKNALGWSQY